MNFCILGAGAWGTALAISLARSGNSVTLIPRRPEQAQALQEEGENRDYLPGVPLDKNILISTDLESALNIANACILACPTQGLRALCEKITPLFKPHWDQKCFITLCKGLEPKTLLRPTQVMEESLPKAYFGVLNGPNYAKEIAQGKPAATVLASSIEDSTLIKIQEAISSDTLRVYRSKDIVGAELAGALKNVYAIGAGILDGLKLGDNAKAAYLTRALHEMVRLGSTLGGEKATFYGLSGMGDLVATCEGEWSRNRTFGQRLGSGDTIEALLKNRKTVVEGYNATQCFQERCTQEGIEGPILKEVYAVLFEEKPPQEAVTCLMTRSLKAEEH
tara:strand:+ start:48093 stop:49097 length:1005 start_codon:yes stop_codon:yes gene_type:complete